MENQRNWCLSLQSGSTRLRLDKAGFGYERRVGKKCRRYVRNAALNLTEGDRNP